MLNQHIMQVKRELWENKKFIFVLPSALASILIFLLVAGMSYIAFSDNNVQINVQINGHFLWSSSWVKTDENQQVFENTQWLFASDNAVDKQSMLPANADFTLTDFPTESAAGSSKAVSQKNDTNINFSVPIELIVVFLALAMLTSGMSRDKKDGSIYFWRSLPVSEARNVLTKLFAAVAVLPMVYFVITVVTGVISISLIGLFEPLITTNKTQYMPMDDATWVMLTTAANGLLVTFYAMLLALPVIGLSMAMAPCKSRLTFPAGFAVGIFSIVLERFIFDHSYISEALSWYGRLVLDAMQAMRADGIILPEVYQLLPAMLVGILLIMTSIFIRRWQID